MTIIFTEDRELLNKSIVHEGEECDFGEAQNAAFVANGVAVYKGASDEEEDHH